MNHAGSMGRPGLFPGAVPGAKRPLASRFSSVLTGSTMRQEPYQHGAKKQTPTKAEPHHLQNRKGRAHAQLLGLHVVRLAQINRIDKPHRIVHQTPQHSRSRDAPRRKPGGLCWRQRDLAGVSTARRCEALRASFRAFHVESRERARQCGAGLGGVRHQQRRRFPSWRCKAHERRE